MTSSIPLIALVGRTNVGKSTLFNELLGYKRSLVDNRDGLTRDCLVETVKLNDDHFLTLVDTGGLDRSPHEVLDKAFLDHTYAFLKQVDHCLFVLDASVGLMQDDVKLYQKLLQDIPHVTLVWNKSDLIDDERLLLESRKLNNQEPLRVSHKDPVSIQALKDFLVGLAVKQDSVAEATLNESFGIFGRPNVGKSSLSNALVKDKKFLVSEEAGTTRDFTSAQLNVQGRSLTLFDTAGILSHAQKHPDMLERMTYFRTLVAIKKVAVGVLMIDAQDGLTNLDLKILNMLEQHRRGLIVVVNKWDLLDPKERTYLMEHLNYQLKGYGHCPIFPISVKSGYNLKTLEEAVLTVIDAFQKTLTTGQVNKALERFVDKHQPPLVGLFRIKLRYAHVVDTHPLSIMIHGNQVQRLPEHYKKYLKNSFCDYFNLVGIPLKLEFKTSNNPYAPSE